MRSRLPERLAPRVHPLATEVAVGGGAAILALLIRLSLLPLTGHEAPYAVVFVGVLLACLLAGWRSGLIALCIGQGLAWYFVVSPAGSFKLDQAEFAALAMASTSQLLLVAMTGLYQREIDDDARRMTEQIRLREILVNELNHRVKNTLAIVQSIGHQSLRPDTPPEEAASAFEGRLMALAAAHQILTREHWHEVKLGDLIATTLEPHGGTGTRFILDGPEVRLSPKTSVTCAMTLHELATNALKYGALSHPDGHVAISWSVADGRFRLKWQERNGPPCSKPPRRGFGTRMLERALASDISGKASLDFARAGLVYSLEGPAKQPL